MINQLISRLSRLLPASGDVETAPVATHEDSNWHSSSFELARGLDVIEHRNSAHAVFADTLPAFHPARA